MDNREARAALGRVRKLQERIYQLEEALRQAWDIETSITASPSTERVQNSSERRPGESYAALSDEVERQKQELNDQKVEVLQLIHSVPDNRMATVLIAYYINGKTWEQIAVDTHYSFRHVTRLCRQGLDAVQRIIEERGA